MKVVILAGGYGSRITEESKHRPKPMVEIGEKPILWHIMKSYAHYGYMEFVICAGYKQQMIKDYFANYFLRNSDVTFDFSQNGEMKIHRKYSEPWKVSIIDTGLDTMTGGRVKRVQNLVGDEPFMLTYGDAVSNIDLNELETYHRSKGKIGTISVYNLGQSKGVLEINSDGTIRDFREESDLDGALINIGYMVMNPEIFDYIEGDSTIFEQETLQKLVKDNQLMSREHKGFWKCMDTQREQLELETMWRKSKAPWKIW